METVFERALLSSRLAYPPSGLFRNPLRPEQSACRDVVQAKVDRGEYPLEAAACFCGGRRFKVLAEVDRYRLRVQTSLCVRCGLLGTNPRMTQEAYAAFYDREYRPLYGDGLQDIEAVYRQSRRQSEEVYGYVTARLPAGAGTVFELGSNLGATLSAFQERGWAAAGADYGSERIAQGRSLSGVSRLCAGGIERLEALGEKADLFILQHVLEHFLDLKGTLSRVRALLKPSGALFVEVPGLYQWIGLNCKGDVLVYLQNAHTYHFSLATLDYVMGSCGFQREHGDEYIRAVYRPAGKVREAADVPSGEAARAEAYLRALERRLAPRLVLKRICADLGLLALRDRLIK